MEKGSRILFPGFLEDSFYMLFSSKFFKKVFDHFLIDILCFLVIPNKYKNNENFQSDTFIYLFFRIIAFT